MRVIKALMAVSLVASAGCGGSDPSGPIGGGGGGGGGGTTPVLTTSVNIQNTAFVPPAIRVSPGAVVTWTNSDGVDHNVTFTSSAVADIAAWSSGTRTTTMPATAGTYGYSCTIHAGMNGSVQVQ